MNTLRYATRLKDFLKDEPRLGATERATGTEKRATGKERATGKDPSEHSAPLRERDENAAFDDTRHERGSTSDERPSSASSDPDSPARGPPKERSEETRRVFSFSAKRSASRLALAEKRRVAFESGVALLEAHRVLARASEAEAGALESAERALAAVDRDAVDLEGEGAVKESALDDFRAACDALAATLDGRAALERRARQAAARAHAARAEEQAAADAAGVLRGGG